MNVAQILSFAATNIVKGPINEADAIGWINDALMQMGTNAHKLTTAAISAAVAGMWYDLPADCIKVYEVQDASGDKCNDYEADRGRIRFGVKGDYDVTYYQTPTPVTALDDTPDCHTMLHYPLAYYVAGKHLAAGDLLQEYHYRVNNALAQLQKKGRRVVARPWR